MRTKIEWYHSKNGQQLMLVEIKNGEATDLESLTAYLASKDIETTSCGDGETYEIYALEENTGAEAKKELGRLVKLWKGGL